MAKTQLEDAEKMATRVEINGKLVEFAPVDVQRLREVYADVEPISMPQPRVRVKFAESRSTKDHTKLGEGSPEGN